MKLSTNKYKISFLQHTTGRAIVAAACSIFACAWFASAHGATTARVYIKKILKNGHYQLMVEGKPFVVKGVCYSPIPIGQNHEYDWLADTAKPWMVDGKLMKDMGINTVRFYQPHDDEQEGRQVVRDLYQKFGIRTIMGNWLGYWEYPCPLYGSKEFQDRIKEEVLAMVRTYKDEPGLLMWVLGNENNYSCMGQIRPWTSEEIMQEPNPQKQNEMRAKTYYMFLNTLVEEIHAIDPNHPVAIGNGELVGLDYANKYTPAADAVACIIYRGKTFGNLFNSLKATYDRPLRLAEFGADAYDAYLGKQDQNMQAFFLESQWRQIYLNVANEKNGAGNCLGGVMFEWSDEWWKHNETGVQSWFAHDTESNWSNPSYYFDVKAKDNKNMNEEWFGVVALSPDEQNGLNIRIPRKAYYVVREFWKNPRLHEKVKRKKR